MIFIPTDQGLLVYGACSVLLSNADTVNKMMDPFTGFYRRLYAMGTWIYNTMYEIDRLPELTTSLEYAVQYAPNGLAESFLVGEQIIGDDSVCLILGDNLFYGRDLRKSLSSAVSQLSGATVFGYYVNDPER